MLEYLSIGESGELPNLDRLKHFKVMVIIETVVSQRRQDETRE